MRLRRGVLAISPGAIGGGLVALALLAATKISVVPFLSTAHPVIVAAVLAGVVLAGGGLTFLFGFGRKITNEEMASILDLRYALAERITMGWEIVARGGAKNDLEVRAVEAAVASAARVDPKGAVAVRPPRALSADVASFVLPIVLALLLPAWVPPFVAEKRVETETVKKAGKELEKEAEALAATPTPTPDPKTGATPPPVKPPQPDENDPVQKMKKLAKKMQKGDVSKREAMKELGEIEKELARKQAEAKKSEAARQLARAADKLEKSNNEEMKKLGKALSEAEAEEIRKEQRELEKKFDKGEFEKKQQQTMAEELDELANALEQGGDPESARELREAAKALRKGDQKSAKEHLEKADIAAATQGAREADPVSALAEALKENSETKPTGKAIDQGSRKKTAEELEKLAQKLENGELGKEGEQKLQETLEKAAKEGSAQGENSPGGKMSKPLAKASESLKEGNEQGAAEALRDLSRGMQKSAEQAKKNAQAREAVSQARQRLSGSKGQKVAKMEWGDYGQEGEGEGEGEGEEGEGQCSGPGCKKKHAHKKEASGSNQAGTEAGSGTSKYQDKGFQAENGPQLDRQSDRKSDWRKEYEQAYKAARTNDAKLQDTKLQGKMGPGETQYVETEGKPEKGSASERLVNVPNDYRDAAEEAVGNEDIPPEHRDRVKAYFEALSGQQDEKK